MAELAPTFAPGSFADSLPRQEINYASSALRRDPLDVLPPGPAKKLAALRQRSRDFHSLIPSFEDARGAQLVVTGHSRRISDLTRHPSVGGYGLDADAQQVAGERKSLERATLELRRIETIRETRSARWNAVGQVERAVSNWVEHGLPGGCFLKAVADRPVSELLKKPETIAAAISRYRGVLEKLGEELRRVRASPYPSAEVKAVARDQINKLADAAAPDISTARQCLGPVVFATSHIRALASSLDPKSPPPLVHVEISDGTGMLAWLFRDQLIAKVVTLIDQGADDRNALGKSRREEIEAELNAALLSAERDECALIWAADAAGETVDFRPDTTPEAVIGVELISVSPAAAPPASSPEHAWRISIGS